MDADVATPGPQKIFTLKNIVGCTLVVLMAAVFIFSGYSKIHNDNAFDNFQWSFLDLGINSQIFASVLARVMIGFEFMLGLFLLGHVYLRQFTYKAVIAILAIFIIYLILLIAKQGNNGDCGCFGDQLAMKPMAAIIKNVIMIAVTLLLMKIYPVKPYKYQEYVVSVLCAAAFSAPFLMNFIDIGTAPVPNKSKVDLSKLYQFGPKPDVDLTKGKHIIAFMHYTCKHCRKAAYLLQIIHRDHPDYPIYMVLDGAPEHEKGFFDETHAEGVPHLAYHHTAEFLDMAGKDGVPSIFWMNNGVVEYKSRDAYYQLDPKYMGDWLKGKELR